MKVSRQQILYATIFLAALSVVVWLTATLTRETAVEELRRTGAGRLKLFVSNLTSELEKYEFLPQILAKDERIIRLLIQPGDRAHVTLVNRYLEQANTISGASDIYVIDQDGLTLVASNWNSPKPFVGKNFGFRPYFQAAIRGETGRYPALGMTSNRRGYYYASPVEANGRILGVAVVKVSPEAVEAAWAGAPEKVIVTDYNGVIFITNEPAWRFKTLRPLPAAVVDEIKLSRQYADSVLAPLPVVEERPYDHGGSFLTIQESSAVRYLIQSQEMPTHQWRVHLLSDTRKVDVQIAYFSGYAAVSVITIFLILMYLLQRRRNLIQRLQHQTQIEETLLHAHRDLEVQVRQRTEELTEANRQLDHKVREQQRTAEDLRNTQEELLQSAKLAALGQMSAGITHELNQPLTAIQTYLGIAQQLLEHRQYDELNGNLSDILSLTDRMARFTGQLKTFSRKSTTSISELPLKQTIEDALVLITHTHKQAVKILKSFPDYDVLVLADALRLEQVFVNLFKNAMEAMRDCKDAKLYVSIEPDGGSIRVQVRDTGPGVPAEDLSRLFEPFFTDKEAGIGLGLGLSISQDIVNSFGGTIKVTNHPAGGAEFTVTLQAAESGEFRASNTTPAGRS